MVIRTFFITFTLTLLLVTHPTTTHAANNKNIVEVCEHYHENLDDYAQVLCDVWWDAITSWRYYNLDLVDHLKEEGFKSKAQTIEEYQPFNCVTDQLSKTEFISLYLDYMQEHQDKMEDLFAYTIYHALEPYCKQQRRKNEPAFYLDENEDQKIS